MKTRILFLLFLITTVFAYAQKGGKHQQELQLLADNVFSLSEVMLHDVANPPAASRFYAYALLGAYEAAYWAQKKLQNIDSKLNVDPGIQPPLIPKNFNLSFCTNYTMLQVGRQIMPSGVMLEEKQKLLIEQFKRKKKLSKEDLDQQIRYSE
jgi:hypothetical protein